MECNKDEAIRAKVIAEKKFEANDLIGARKFALKAKSLFPGLEGIQQIISTLDVYIAAETRIDGESDWYGILGVDPQAVELTLKKHYKKLALLLHPDKNNSFGAEGAFKLISESWSVLSDQAKRSAFDQKRNSKVAVSQKVPKPNVPRPTSFPQTTVPIPKSKPKPKPKPKPKSKRKPSPKSNVSKPTPIPESNAPKPTPIPESNVPMQTPIPEPNEPKSKQSPQPKRTSSPIPPPAFEKEKPTFWIACPRCLMQYKYSRMYLHRNLICHQCGEPFYSNEFEIPEVVRNATGSTQAANMVHQVYEQVKRKMEDDQTSDKTKKPRTSKQSEARRGIPELFKSYTAPAPATKVWGKNSR